MGSLCCTERTEGIPAVLKPQRRTYSVLEAERKKEDSEGKAVQEKQEVQEVKDAEESQEKRAARLQEEQEAEEAQKALEMVRQDTEAEAAKMKMEQEESKRLEEEQAKAATKIQAVRRGQQDRRKLEGNRSSSGIESAGGACDADKIKLTIVFVAATELASMNWTGDKPWARCQVPRCGTECHTDVDEGGSLNPRWNQTREIDWLAGEPLHFSVWNKGSIGSKQEGETIVVPSQDFFPDGMEKKLPIPGLGDAELEVSISLSDPSLASVGT